MPPGVLNLIILNVILFVTKQLAGERVNLDYELGLHHPWSPDFHWYQYITSLFMHGDFGHLAFNMLGLWMFGHMLENAYGLKRFLIFYFISGLGASLIYQVWISIVRYNLFDGAMSFTEVMNMFPPENYLIGASGAVYGLMMGAALLFPNTEMYFMGFMGIPVRLKWLAVIYGGGELVRAYQSESGDNVAHLAHIGGMIFGFILVKIYARDKTHFY